MEHCFRAISMKDLASSMYHWIPQKIRVHLFFSHLAYLFLALIHHVVSDTASLTSTTEVLEIIRITLLVREKSVRRVITSKDERRKR